MRGGTRNSVADAGTGRLTVHRARQYALLEEAKVLLDRLGVAAWLPTLVAVRRGEAAGEHRHVGLAAAHGAADGCDLAAGIRERGVGAPELALQEMEPSGAGRVPAGAARAVAAARIRIGFRIASLLGGWLAGGSTTAGWGGGFSSARKGEYHVGGRGGCGMAPRLPHATEPRSDPVTQDERLAKRDALRSEIVKLEESIRLLLEQEELLLKDCAHTYAGGQSALVGGRTKICVHCGRAVAGKDDKLWG